MADTPVPAERSRPSESERRWMLALAAVAGSAVIFTALIAFQKPDIGGDALLVVDAARRTLAGAPMYDDPTAAEFGPSTPHYYGPPALAAAFAPLAGLPDAWIVRITLILGVAIAMAGIAILLRASRQRPTRSMIAGVFIGGLLSFNVYGGAALGNPSVLVLPLLAVGFLGLERDRPWLAGLGIGTAAALRLYPLALLLPLLIARRWRALGASLAVIAAWTALGLVFGGIDATVQYIGIAQAVNVVPDPTHIVTNAALPALAERAGLPDAVVIAIRLASWTLGVIGLIAAGLLMRGGDVAQRMIAFGTGIAGSILLLATMWRHYEVAVIIVVVGIVLSTRRASAGLLSIALASGVVGGAVAMVWIPALGLVRLWQTRAAASGQIRTDVQ